MKIFKLSMSTGMGKQARGLKSMTEVSECCGGSYKAPHQSGS